VQYLFPDTESLTKLYDLIAKGHPCNPGSKRYPRDSDDALFSKTALELIGQGGLGYSFDTFNDSSQNQYAQAIKKLL
jgi:hypothetical protein